MLTVVTPTYMRPGECVALLENLAGQTTLPGEVVIVDGADNFDTSDAVARVSDGLPFEVRYLRAERGTAAQRNFGAERANGDLIALIDDDVRLEPDFLERIAGVFAEDAEKSVGGVVGYRTNRHFKADERGRWRWYRRLGLLRTFEPGRYDFDCGYPINANMQPPFEGTREVDFMTTACAVWRREVFDSGLRFDRFFSDYGVLEDAHFALRAARRWTLLQCGDARCIELHAEGGRVGRRRIGYKSVVNYYFVFRDVARPLSLAQRFRFWRYQAFEFLRIGSSAIRRRRWADVEETFGRVEGALAIARGKLENHPHGI